MMSKGRSTVVHILAPSSTASHKFRERLAGLFQWEPIDIDESKNDNDHSTLSQNENPWNQVFGSQNGLFSTKWNSTALQCPHNNTILHWIAVEHDAARSSDATSALLGIQSTTSLMDAQMSLAQAIQSTRSATQIALRTTLGQALSAKHLLGKHALPVLGFGNTDESNNATSSSSSSSSPSSSKRHHHHNNTLKEIGLPFFFEATNGDGLSVMDQFGQSGWPRPAPGLYQSPAGGPCVRPLPAAIQDQSLSPPTLVFHCSSLEEWKESTLSNMDNTTNSNLQVAPIGKTGINQGQLLLRNPDWQGMDIRVCESPSYSPMFAEAQESLLAASLPELQSSHVLEGAKGNVDPKTEKMDCWAEFRATVRNPRGFLKRNEVVITKTAKAPDLPYE